LSDGGGESPHRDEDLLEEVSERLGGPSLLRVIVIETQTEAVRFEEGLGERIRKR
jgi:hypothetical protein